MLGVVDDPIRIGAAALALGVSVDTLRRWERDGRVTFERRGRERVMDPQELARLLRERAPTDRRMSARNRLRASSSTCSATASWRRSTWRAAHSASSR